MKLRNLKEFNNQLNHWVYLSQGLGEPVVISVKVGDELTDIVIIEGHIFTLPVIYSYLIACFYGTIIEISEKNMAKQNEIASLDGVNVLHDTVFRALHSIKNPIEYVKMLENYIEKSRMNPIELMPEK